MSTRILSMLSLGLILSGTTSAFAKDAGVIESVAMFTNTKYLESSAKFEILLNEKSEIQNFRWVATNQTVPPVHSLTAVISGTTLETYDAPIIGKLETINLQGEKIDYVSGEGRLTFKFLNDGMSRIYISCPMVLKRSDKGVWQLFNSNDKGRLNPILKAKIVVDPSKGVEKVEGLNCKVSQ